MIFNKIKEHLATNKITFRDHFVLAIKSGVMLLYAGITSIIHAFLPSLFDGVPAKIVSKLYNGRIKDHPNPRYRNFK